MGNYVISCCSTVDLSRARLEKRNIAYACFHFSLDGHEYKDDFWESMTPSEMYRRMLAGEDSKTSQITVLEYETLWEPYLEAGQDLIHVTLSSGISGTYNSACIARGEMKEKYPDRKIYVVDSLAASSGYGLLIDQMADLRDGGMEIDELYRWTEENKDFVQHWFFSSDLTFFIRGGRVSKTAGFIGGLVGICPLLHVDWEGRLIPREKIRSKKKVIARIVEKMEENVKDGHDYDGKCFISQSDCEEDAKAVAALIEEKFPKLKGKIEIFPIGATIGAHTGPGTVALFFFGGNRK